MILFNLILFVINLTAFCLFANDMWNTESESSDNIAMIAATACAVAHFVMMAIEMRDAEVKRK